ncbi:MAG: hypothetical protein ACRC5M_06450 [Anaeroplasmataceae bacterium]
MSRIIDLYTLRKYNGEMRMYISASDIKTVINELSNFGLMNKANSLLKSFANTMNISGSTALYLLDMCLYEDITNIIYANCDDEEYLIIRDESLYGQLEAFKNSQDITVSLEINRRENLIKEFAQYIKNYNERIAELKTEIEVLTMNTSV